MRILNARRYSFTFPCEDYNEEKSSLFPFWMETRDGICRYRKLNLRWNPHSLPIKKWCISITSEKEQSKVQKIQIESTEGMRIIIMPKKYSEIMWDGPVAMLIAQVVTCIRVQWRRFLEYHNRLDSSACRWTLSCNGHSCSNWPHRRMSAK